MLKKLVLFMCTLCFVTISMASTEENKSYYIKAQPEQMNQVQQWLDNNRIDIEQVMKERHVFVVKLSSEQVSQAENNKAIEYVELNPQRSISPPKLTF